MMTEQIIISLISSIIGGAFVAVINQLFTRPKMNAEIEKSHAETKKLLAETEKINNEIMKLNASLAVIAQKDLPIMLSDDKGLSFMEKHMTVQRNKEAK
jgi:cell division protein FtsB